MVRATGTTTKSARTTTTPFSEPRRARSAMTTRASCVGPTTGRPAKNSAGWGSDVAHYRCSCPSSAGCAHLLADLLLPGELWLAPAVGRGVDLRPHSFVRRPSAARGGVVGAADFGDGGGRPAVAEPLGVGLSKREVARAAGGRPS